MTYDHWKTTPPDFGEPPLVEVACEMCGGEGQFEEPLPFTKWTDDPHGCRVVKCENCNGTGAFLCEAETDR
jgi:hypothetical protein